VVVVSEFFIHFNKRKFMTEQIEYIKSNGFKIPKSTSETVRAHLYLLGRHGAVIYRPSKNEDVSEEFKSVAQSLGITIFSNNGGYCFVNESGAGGPTGWMA
jgi:hypothetical protein